MYIQPELHIIQGPPANTIEMKNVANPTHSYTLHYILPSQYNTIPGKPPLCTWKTTDRRDSIIHICLKSLKF